MNYTVLWNVHSSFHCCENYKNRLIDARVIVENKWFLFIEHGVVVVVVAAAAAAAAIVQSKCPRATSRELYVVRDVLVEIEMKQALNVSIGGKNILKRRVFYTRLKELRSAELWTSAGRLFQARVFMTAKTGSPTVDRLVPGMTSLAVKVERSRRRVVVVVCK